MSHEEHAVVVERLETKDALLFRLSDVLDTKASISLVVITFLATQTAGFFADGLSGWLWWCQLGVAVVLASAGLFAMGALWPREFDIETSEELDTWVAQLRAHFRDEPDADAKVKAELTSGRIASAKARIKRNGSVDALKSQFIGWIYRCVSVAVVMNMGTVIVMAFA